MMCPISAAPRWSNVTGASSENGLSCICSRSSVLSWSRGSIIMKPLPVLRNSVSSLMVPSVPLPLVKTHHAPSSLQWRRRTALSTTQIDERIIATHASMGLSTQPVNG